MNKMQEVIDAVNAISAKYYNANNKARILRSPYRQWDRIIGTVCIGCGIKLGRYENLNNLAFCYSCREILFPETVTKKEVNQRKFSNRKF